MPQDASSSPLAFTINRFLAPRLLEAWLRIRFDDEVADRCVAAINKRDRLGSRDRKRLSQAVFTALRSRGAVDAILGAVANDKAQARLWLATAFQQSWPDGPEALKLDPKADCPTQSGNLPPAMLRHLSKSHQADELLQLGLALRKRAGVTLRSNLKKGSREQLAALLAAAGVDSKPTPFASAGLSIGDASKLGQLPSELRTGFEIQDEGSQLLAMLLGAQTGDHLLDACAGAGGKTLALLDSKARVEASDVDSARLERLIKRVAKLGGEVPTHTLQTEGPLPFEKPFDRVLVDAPCSGTGTGRRAPDLLWRFNDERLSHYTALQAQILERFASAVRPGGFLVYATCSLIAAENEDQIEHFLGRHPEFKLCSPSITLGDDLARRLGAERYLKLSPHLHDCDGFFGALLRRSL
jgi:16S rRNA (cytosine967-C5)-methyltransferase